MINNKTYTKEHLYELLKNKKADPQIIERAVVALGLLEAMRKVSIDFCFKGGSALMIMGTNVRRLSTDN